MGTFGAFRNVLSLLMWSVMIMQPSEFFYFLTSWITSSSSSTWSLPTFCGLCFTDDPHTNALQREERYDARHVSTQEYCTKDFTHGLKSLFTDKVHFKNSAPNILRHVIKPLVVWFKSLEIKIFFERVFPSIPQQQFLPKYCSYYSH